MTLGMRKTTMDKPIIYAYLSGLYVPIPHKNGHTFVGVCLFLTAMYAHITTVKINTAPKRTGSKMAKIVTASDILGRTIASCVGAENCSC